MTRSVLSFAALLALCCCSSNAPSETREPVAKRENLQIQARSDRREYAADEPITVTFVMKNIGEEDVRLSDANPPTLQYRIEVVTDGQPVPSTRWGQRYLSPTQGSNRLVTLPPGDSVAFSVPLNRMFDMTAGGAYRVSIGRVVLGPPGAKPVVFNAEPLILRVSDGPVFREEWGPAKGAN